MSQYPSARSRQYLEDESDGKKSRRRSDSFDDEDEEACDLSSDEEDDRTYSDHSSRNATSAKCTGYIYVGSVPATVLVSQYYNTQQLASPDNKQYTLYLSCEGKSK